MKHVSIKMTDAEHEKMEWFRGACSKSEYIRMALSAHDETTRNENTDFHKLFSDVGLMKDSLKGLATKKDLLALARFIVEVATAGDPLSYSHEQAKIQQFFQTLESKIESEG